jgi:hypothetical protein
VGDLPSERKEAARVERPDRSSQGAHKLLASFSGESLRRISSGRILMVLFIGPPEHIR